MSPASEGKWNVVFLGETGVGKSSVIHLLLETSSPTQVSDVPRPHTQVGVGQPILLNGTKCTLWDTRGLREASPGFLRNLFRFETGPEKELKKFLKERHQRGEFDLLVYCVHGSRATATLAKYYHKFCAATRRLAAPVVILVTHLESEPDMENWWSRNHSHLKDLKMEFDGHACITAITGHTRTAESKKRLVDLITKKHLWKVQHTGSYFGSQPRTTVAHTASRPDEPRSASTEGANVIETDMEPQHVNEPSQLPITEASRVGLLRAQSPSSVSTSYTGVPLQSCEDYLAKKPPLEHSTATVVRRKGYATLNGSFGDIWECDLIQGESSYMVAVKALKLPRNINHDLRVPEKKLRRELRVWGKLQHQNIVPLLGVVSDFGPLPSMVSPWFSNGSLSSYLENRLMSTPEKRQLVRDIAAGLSYLHGNKIIHGDLHSDNVLINGDGRACLTDFGLSFVPEFVGKSYLKSSICGALQFADPALVQRVQRSTELSLPTHPCDVYSFGGLMLHALSQQKPYGELSLGEMLRKISAEERPDIPMHSDITSPEKSLIQKCWDREKLNRPSADDLVKILAQQFL